MPTIDEIRRINLNTLIKEAGGNKALADELEVSESQLSQWANGSANSSTGTPRGMRTATAQKIEAARKKPRGWLDQMHSADDATAPPEPAAPTLEQALEVLGMALAVDMPNEVREDLADALAKLARRKGVERDQAHVQQLLADIDADPTEIRKHGT